MANLEKLMQLREEATINEWKRDGTYIYSTLDGYRLPIGKVDHEDNAEYIIQACNAIPELVNTIRDMEKAIANMGIMIAAAYKNQTSEGGNDAGRKNA